VSQVRNSPKSAGEWLARTVETTTAAMAAYSYDQIDQAEQNSTLCRKGLAELPDAEDRIAVDKLDVAKLGARQAALEDAAPNVFELR
jgi:hypothetical protein